MGGRNVEEVTCTVIGGVTYNQVCTADSKIRTAEDEDSMTGALLWNSKFLDFEMKCSYICQSFDDHLILKVFSLIVINKA